MANEFLSSITIQNGLVTAGTFSAITVADLPGGEMGTVTSIDVSGGSTGLTTSGGPVTTSGVITIAGTVNAAHGGTGATTLTANAVLLGEGTSPVGFATIGTAGRLLIDQGAGLDPAFKVVSGDATMASSGALTLVNTGTAGTYGKVTTDAQGRVTSGGTNDVAHGGTGDTTFTAYAVICGGTTSTGALQSIAGVGTAGQVLTSNGAGALPTFQAAGGGSSPPFADNSPLVMNNADNTKEIIFSAAGITTGTTRTYTGPDYNGTLAVINHTQTFTALNTFGPNRITSPFGSGTGNEAFGASAGASGASGNNCTILGNAAGTALTTGTDNTLIGYQAGTQFTTQQQNVVVGTQAMSTGGGSQHVAVGWKALAAGGNQNQVAVGYQALAAQTGGFGNDVAVGSNALSTQSSGYRNTAVGSGAGNIISSGTENIIIGFNAGTTTLTTGSDNIIIGILADTSTSSTNDGIALGRSAVCPGNTFVLGPFINGQEFHRLSSTSTDRIRASFIAEDVDNTDATRKYRIRFTVYDTASREFMRAEASGSAAKLGFLGTGAVVQQAGTGETAGFTAGTGTTVHDDSTFTGNVGATAYRISDIVKALKNYGLLAS